MTLDALALAGAEQEQRQPCAAGLERAYRKAGTERRRVVRDRLAVEPRLRAVNAAQVQGERDPADDVQPEPGRSRGVGEGVEVAGDRRHRAAQQQRLRREVRQHEHRAAQDRADRASVCPVEGQLNRQQQQPQREGEVDFGGEHPGTLSHPADF